MLVGHKNVNVHWLLTGEGEMFLTPPPDQSTQVSEPAAPYGKGGLLLGDLERILEAHRREIEALRERVTRLEGEIKNL